MIVREACPECGSNRYKKNGHTRHGKQNHQCKACERQFSASAENHVISHERRTLVENLLRERISLHGICRAMGVSLTWLLHFMVECFAACPEHLHVQLPAHPTKVIMHTLEAEADEMWSFVEKKENKQWIWLAMDAKSRQIIAFHVGDRSRESAKALWANIPEVYQHHATFHTDQYEVYTGVIPAARHHAISKKARKTNHLERFNNTLRQRVSRLVREALSFSKSLANHMGAIKLFICHYNLRKRQHYLCSTTLATALMQEPTQCVRTAAWYAKEQPTFADALALVRRCLWSSCHFQTSHLESDVVQISRSLFVRLTDAVCYAA